MPITTSNASLDTHHCILVQTTLKEHEQAVCMAQALVKEGLVACTHIVGPVTSVYRYNGEMCTEQEYVLIAKTFESLWDAVEHAIKQRHPYEVPELIALPLHSLSSQYKEWMIQCTNL